MIRKSDAHKIRERYNADHDVGPEAPIPWHTMLLLEMIEDLQAQVKALQDALPSGTRPTTRPV